MGRENNIYTIGYEGANRTGKGTQIDLMSELLTNNSLPHIVIRGDGSRQGIGMSPGDPFSEQWKKVNGYLRNPETDRNVWNTTSYRLARELIVWRDRILPQVIQQSGAESGFLLVDRSILSRTLVPREIKKDMAPDAIELYSPDMREEGMVDKKGRTLSVHDVVPDILFELVAPKDKLLARFDDSDPKNVWRKWLVENRYDWYLNAAQYIPTEYTERVVRINADKAPEEVFADIITHINSKFDLNLRPNNG
jgi:thymidylate kinase